MNSFVAWKGGKCAATVEFLLLCWWAEVKTHSLKMHWPGAPASLQCRIRHSSWIPRALTFKLTGSRTIQETSKKNAVTEFGTNFTSCKTFATNLQVIWNLQKSATKHILRRQDGNAHVMGLAAQDRLWGSDGRQTGLDRHAGEKGVGKAPVAVIDEIGASFSHSDLSLSIVFACIYEITSTLPLQRWKACGKSMCRTLAWYSV